MRDKRLAQRCSSETGAILPFVAAGMTAMLLLLALALDQGIRYSGRTQLQQVVDSSAQAALMALNRTGAGQAEAIAAARQAANLTPVTGGGFSGQDLIIEFGRYSFANGDFDPMPSGTPQAVRVTANKIGDSGFEGLSGRITANAESIAALRCLNLVFVQDVSSSFDDSIRNVQSALRATVDLLRNELAFGAETRVGLVAFRNIVVPRATTPSLVPVTSSTITDVIEALDDPDVVCTSNDDDVLTTGIVPACVGSDMLDGLRRAEALLAAGNGKNEACEDFVLTISDGVPCRFEEADLPFGARFGPALPGEPQGGGSSSQDTLAFVNERMRTFGSISVLTTNDARGGLLSRCPTERGDPDINVNFARQLITGFGRSFESNRNTNAMAAEMSAALRGIPPVTVPSDSDPL
jgi:hypothetical protein